MTKCRHCAASLHLSLVDLGSAPPSNAYLNDQSLQTPEKWYPLRVMVCQRCWLAQTEDFAQASELFTADYSYFSGISTTWLAHCENFVIEATRRFRLDSKSLVVELAANDGHLLQYFQTRSIPCLGVEPTASTAAVARHRGLAILEAFFSSALASQLVSEGPKPDLIVANNVLAHVPDINDFINGVGILLRADGVAVFEFHHLLRLVEGAQFDTIYHEHFSYLSLIAAQKLFSSRNLEIFDVEELETHGGSLRVYVQHVGTGRFETLAAVRNVLEKEERAGVTSEAFYHGFQLSVQKIKIDFVSFLINACKNGQSVAGYGAAAKANTLLNFAGIRRDLVHFIVDRSSAKQGKFMPGSHIPIVNEEFLRSTKPDYIVIFPWNIREEVTRQLGYIRGWNGRFVTAVPELVVEGMCELP